MRYVIYGAGAIGGTIGARLHSAGSDVLLIARGAHLDALRRDGLRFVSPEGESILRIPVAGNPAEAALREGDIVFLTMKTQDAETALIALQHAAGGLDLPIICAQNGVENERLALRRFERVYAMLVILPATHMEPGVVEATSSGITGVLDAGRYPDGADHMITRVCADLERAGFRARPDPQAMRKKYAKLLGNLNNTLAAALGDVRAPEVARELTEEAVACYRAAGIEWTGDAEMAALREGMRSAGGRQGNSTWQSLARGTGSIESDYLNGEIVLLGRLHGVPTPVNAALQRIGSRMAAEGIAPGTLVVADVIREVEAEGRIDQGAASGAIPK